MHNEFLEAGFTIVQPFTLMTPAPVRLSLGANQRAKATRAFLQYAGRADDKANVEQQVLMFVLGYASRTGSPPKPLPGWLITDMQRCADRIERRRETMPTWSRCYPHELASSTYIKAVKIARAFVSTEGFEAHVTDFTTIKTLPPTIQADRSPAGAVVLSGCTGQAELALLDLGYTDVVSLFNMAHDSFSEALLHSVLEERYVHIKQRALESAKQSPDFAHNMIYFDKVEADDVKVPVKTEWHMAFESKFGANTVQEELYKVCTDLIPSRGRQLPRRPPITALELFTRRISACRR